MNLQGHFKVYHSWMRLIVSNKHIKNPIKFNFKINGANTNIQCIFKFNLDLWIQLVGVALGNHPAPSCSNMYLVRRLDDKITALGIKYGSNGKSAWHLFKSPIELHLKIP